MTQHFVIAIESIDEDHKKILRAFFAEHGSWWNWIPGFWMFVSTEDITTSAIRDKIREITASDNSDMMVLQVTPVTWSGYGPSTETRNMFKWLRNHWKRERASVGK
jgi:hypothetical protein